LLFGRLDRRKIVLNLLHRVAGQALGSLGWIERFLRAQLAVEGREPTL
jgi:hypothetical protein